MKHLTLIILFFATGANPTFAQVPIAVQVPKSPRCCCCCDSASIQHAVPAKHWNEVRYNVSLFSPVLIPLRLTEFGPNSGETVNTRQLGNAHLFGIQIWGLEVSASRFFVGTDASLGFASQYTQALSAPQLQLRPNGVFQMGLKTGLNVLTTERARVYVQAKGELNRILLGIRREANTIGQASWNRFLWQQDGQIDYQQLTSALIDTDVWENRHQLSHTLCTGQIGLGYDYRVGKFFRVGAYVGYVTQFTPETSDWLFSYERYQDDDSQRYRITGVPIRADLSGVTANVTLGYVLTGKHAAAH